MERNSPASCGVKILFLAIATGAGTAFIRSITGFFPVLQGMFTGIAAGGASGLLLKKTSPPPSERAWLWLNAFLTSTLVLGIVLDFFSAQPFSPPFSWLRNVLRGGETEYFFGAPIFSWGLYGGALSGPGWIFFNALDSVFFFFSGLITLGVSADKAKRPRKRSSAVAAKKFFLIQWGAIMLIFLAFSIMGASGRLRAREALSSFEGRYLFSDGMNLLLPSGQGGSFTVEVSGHGSLALRSEPENNYYVSISKQGRYFQGRLYRGKSLERVFLKFSEGGRVLISARRKPPGGGKYDLILEAGRE